MAEDEKNIKANCNPAKLKAEMNDEVLEIEQNLQGINSKLLGSYEQDSKFDSETDKVSQDSELYPISKISDRIYLGSKHGVSEETLKQNNIQYVINMADELDDELPRAFTCFKISHFKKYAVSEVYDEIFEEFYNTLLSIPVSSRIFVHCKHGKSRSAVMIIGLLMRQFRVDYKRALHWLKSKRPIVEPNYRFAKWLKKINLQEFHSRAKPLPITTEKGQAKQLTIPVEGYFSQYGQKHKMEIKALTVDLEGRLKASGADENGHFFIVGSIDRSGNTSMVKQYSGKHCINLKGNLTETSIAGKWDIRGTGDEFNLELKMSRLSGSGINSSTNEGNKLEMNLQIDDFSGDVNGISFYETGTNFIYGKSSGDKIFFLQQYLGGGDSGTFIFEGSIRGKVMSGTWKDATGNSEGSFSLNYF